MAGIDFDTIAGTKLFIAASSPATNDVAGFEALTFVEFGQLTSIGEVIGREYSMSSVTTVGDAQEREKKGTFKLPNAEWEFVWAKDDPGQIIGLAASKNYSVPSFMVVDQDVDSISYFTGQVATFKRNGGGPNDALLGTMTILRQTDTIDG